MSKTRDIWYVRFPDGQVVRAKSTRSVRRHLEMGRIPFDCRVRRSGQYEWTTLDWTPEFADLLKQPAKNDKPQPKAVEQEEAPGDFELHTVGIRGLVEELATALDSTMHTGKLTFAALSGLLTSGLLVLFWFFPINMQWTAELGFTIAVGVGILAILALCTAVIGRITVIELSQLRAPSRREVAASMLGNTIKILFSWLVVGGVLSGAIIGARELPSWLSTQGSMSEVAMNGVVIASMILQVVLFPTFALMLLIAPTIVVEDCSAFGALRQWFALVRQNLLRVFLYEAMIGVLGLVSALPFLAAVSLAGWNSPATLYIREAASLVLYGLAATPFLAYLIVANVFIYLNLRYEFSASAK